ncbi:MAG: hypothetical protein SV253_09060 [Halobacteria archaeon]|nr:hypothetical protein [Halobacteria archaeon]
MIRRLKRQPWTSHAARSAAVAVGFYAGSAEGQVVGGLVLVALAVYTFWWSANHPDLGDDLGGEPL